MNIVSFLPLDGYGEVTIDLDACIRRFHVGEPDTHESYFYVSHDQRIYEEQTDYEWFTPLEYFREVTSEYFIQMMGFQPGSFPEELEWLEPIRKAMRRDPDRKFRWNESCALSKRKPVKAIESQDDLMTLAVAAESLSRRRGQKIYTSTVWRWTKHGCKGVLLECTHIGKTRHVSQEMLYAFFERLAHPGHVPTEDKRRGYRSAAKRQRESEAAGRKLEKMGA
jgi:hypothetical protein